MLEIFKYILKLRDEQEVELPAGASILCCQAQGNEPYLWAIVDPEAPTELRRIFIVGTGHELPFEPHATRYIGTVQQHGGVLVLHVFEPIKT